mgnify:CR=1 FL=1
MKIKVASAFEALTECILEITGLTYCHVNNFKEALMPIIFIIFGIVILLIIFGVIRFIQEIIDGLSRSRRARAPRQTRQSQPVRHRRQEQTRHIAGEAFNQYGEITEDRRFNRFGEINDERR